MSEERKRMTTNAGRSVGDKMWDFWSLSPESLHQVTILFSDRGTPDGYRHLHGFSSHAFSLNQKLRRAFTLSRLEQDLRPEISVRMKKYARIAD